MQGKLTARVLLKLAIVGAIGLGLLPSATSSQSYQAAIPPASFQYAGGIPGQAPPLPVADAQESAPAGAAVSAQAAPSRLAPPYVNLQLTLERDEDVTSLAGLLALLDRQSARAAFYLTAAFASRHGGVARELVARGHELGVLLGGDIAKLDAAGWGRVGADLASVRQSAGLADGYPLHARFGQYVTSYDAVASRLGELESLGVATLSGVFTVGPDFFCRHCAENGRLMYPLAAPSAPKLVLIPVGVKAEPVRAAPDRLSSEPAPAMHVDGDPEPLDDAQKRAGGTVLAIARARYEAFVQPDEKRPLPAAGDLERYSHDKFLTLVLRPSISAADATTLATLDGFLARVAARSGGTTTSAQVANLTFRALAGGYLSSLTVAANTPAATPGSPFVLTVDYFTTLYCPTFYFRIYGKYPSQAVWQMLGQVSYYVNTGPHSFTFPAVLPLPPKGDEAYDIVVVGQSCKAGGCSWPDLVSFEKKASTSITALQIKKLSVLPDQPMTNLHNTLEASVTRPADATVEWLIEPIGSRTTMPVWSWFWGKSDKPIPTVNVKGLSADYFPKPNTHGEKRATATVTWQIGGKTYQAEKPLEFELFFRKGPGVASWADDDGDSYPNWYEYWQEDGAVPDLDKTHYDPSLPANTWGENRGGGRDDVWLGARAGADNPASAINGHSFGGGNGIDNAAQTVAHERYHGWVTEQWATGVFTTPDSDYNNTPCVGTRIYNDKLPDSYETATSGTSITKTDTFGLGVLYSPSYNCYGDNEYMARWSEGEEPARPVKGVAARDWAFPGKQSTPVYAPRPAAGAATIEPRSGTGAAPASRPSGLANVTPIGVMLAGSYADAGRDANGDGLFDFLAITATVNITMAGSFGVVGWLEDTAGSPIGWANAVVAGPTGVAGVPLLFDGKLIYQHSADGPYRLRRVNLGDEVVLDSQEYPYTTTAYLRNQFQRPEVTLTGAFTSTVRDADGDGQHDFLDIGVGLRVESAGSYSVTADLHALSGLPVAGASADVFGSGVHTITLSFEGRSIRQYRADGPYSLQYFTVRNAGGTPLLVAMGAFTTTAYAYTDFESGPAELSGDYSDAGVDADGNGKFEALRLTAGITVTMPGTYYLRGTIRQNIKELSGDEFIDNCSDFVMPNLSLVGDYVSVTLDFPGRNIYRCGVNGPFSVTVSLHDNGGNLVSFEPGVYRTWPYPYAAFAPGATISGTVRDFAGIPVPGAAVSLAGPRADMTTTDASGQYTVTGLAAGWYQLYVAPPPESHLREASGQVVLTADQWAVADFTLPAGGWIAGWVLDRDGAPITATIDLGTFEPPHYPTDEYGYYVVRNLAPGTYMVVVNADANDQWWTYVDDRHVDNLSSTTIQVLTGTTTFVTFKQPPATPIADLYVNVALLESIVGPGEETTYLVRYRNLGTAAAASARVTATIPGPASYVADSAPAGVTTILTGSEAVWSVPALATYDAAGDEGTITLTVRFADAMLPGDLATTTVSISGPTPEADYLNNRFTHSAAAVLPVRDLQVVKSLTTGQPFVGQTIQYQVSYQFSGNATAAGVRITETLPAPLSYVSDSNFAGFATAVSGNNVVWTKASLDPGDAGYLYVDALVPEATASGTVLTNVVTIGTRRPETSYANNVYTDTATVAARTRDLGVSGALHWGTPPVPGNDVQFILTLSNAGNSHAANVVITNTLPLSVSYISHNGPWGFTTVLTGSTVVWAAPSLSPGTVYLYVTGRIDDAVAVGTVLTSTTRVSGSDPDIDATNNMTETVFTTIAGTRDMVVSTYLNEGTATPGNIARYWVSIRNLGTGSAADVIVTDTLPVSTTFLSSEGAFSPEVLPATPGAGERVVWRIGREPGAGAQGRNLVVYALISEKVPLGTALVNTATVSSASPEIDYWDNEDTDVQTVVAGSAHTYVQKTMLDYVVVAGAEVHYRLHLGNWSSDAAANVVLTDVLPAGATYVHSTGGGTPVLVADDRVVWNLGFLPGYSNFLPSYRDRTIDLTVLVSDSVPAGTVVTNTAMVSADNDSISGDNVATDVRTVVAATRDLYLAKDLYDGAPVLDGDLTYRLYYRSYSNASARNMVITDVLPSGLSFISATAPFSHDPVQNVISWTLGTVPAPYVAGYEGYLYVTVHVSATLQPETTICNTAHVSTSDTETGTLANTATDCRTVVAPTRDLAVTKYLHGGSPTPGGDIQYRIHYAASGNTASDNVAITDTLPMSLTYLSSEAPAGFSTETVGNTVVWHKASVAAYESGDLYLTARIAADMPEGAIFTNTAAIATDSAEVDYDDNVATITLAIPSPYGGPDAFGYTWRDSTAPNWPAFAWLDATDGVLSSVNGDDNYASVPLGFSFPFYENSYEQVWFSTNGLVGFGAGSTSYSNSDLPNPNSPNDVVAAFWDDLYVGTGQGIYYEQGGVAPNRYLVIQWNGVTRYADRGQPLTFEAVFYEDGKIVLQYLDLNGTLDSGTVGIENAAGAVGLRYAFDEPRLAEGLAIVFQRPAAPRADFVASPLSGVAPLAVTFTNTTAGTYHWSRWAFGDGMTSTTTSPVHLYEQPGIYDVSLTVGGAFGGDTMTRTTYIAVSGGVSGTGILSGSVGMAREVAPPAEAYSVPLRVRLYAGGSPAAAIDTTLGTDLYGRFIVPDIATGVYTVTVKNPHSLTNARANVTIGGGTTSVTLCQLAEGDADDSNQVNILDFSVLATVYGKMLGQAGWDPRADFTESGQINIMDFSALATSYGRFGNQACL